MGKRIGFLIVVMVGCVVMLCLWVKMEMVNMAYSLEHLHAQKALLQREADALHLQLSRLTSLDQIATRAANQLGLRPPTPGQVRLIPFALVDKESLSGKIGATRLPGRLQVAKTVGDQE